MVIAWFCTISMLPFSLHLQAITIVVTVAFVQVSTSVDRKVFSLKIFHENYFHVLTCFVMNNFVYYSALSTTIGF